MQVVQLGHIVRCGRAPSNGVLPLDKHHQGVMLSGVILGHPDDGVVEHVAKSMLSLLEGEFVGIWEAVKKCLEGYVAHQITDQVGCDNLGGLYLPERTTIVVDHYCIHDHSVGVVTQLHFGLWTGC